MTLFAFKRTVLILYFLCGCYALKTGLRHKITAKLSMSQTDETSNNVSLKLMASISSLGVLDTGYLSWMKLSSSPYVCGGDCNNVLSGPFSSIPYINLPLSVFGLFGYLLIASLSIREIFVNNSQSIVRPFILALSTATATFSCYLIGILQFIIKSECPFCYASAAFSFALAAGAWSTNLVPNKTKSVVIMISSSSATALSSAFLFYLTTTLNPSEVYARTPEAPVAVTTLVDQEKEVFEPPVVNKESSLKALEVAAQLKEVGAKMYGAYWCSHCYNQKQNLGTGAYKSFEYVECDKKGKDSQYPLCKNKQLKGYPTWEINGQFFPGEKTVEELAEILKDLRRLTVN